MSERPASSVMDCRLKVWRMWSWTGSPQTDPCSVSFVKAGVERGLGFHLEHPGKGGRVAWKEWD